MTNRLLTRLASNFTRLTSNSNNSNSEPPFNFARDQHVTFTADLDRQMLQLEKRHGNKADAPPIPQQRISTVASTVENADGEFEPCTFDDFGLVQGLEIDVSWM